MDECTRPSLGRMAKIGDLYDVRTETLMLSNVFNDNIDEFVEKKSIYVLDSDSFNSTKTSEKLRKLEIDANASLSLLCGTIKAEGSVNFVNNKVCSERAVHCNIVVRKTTKKEQLNYKQLKLREYFELSGHEYATHVVVGITWGANAIITFMDSNKNGNDKEKGKSFKYQREGNANFLGDIKSNETTEDWKGAETKLKAYTDIATGKKLPQTLEEVKEFIDDISTSEKEGNPQMFHLLPIDSLKSFLQMNLGTSTKFSTISQSRIHKIESIFDELDETYGKMKDIVEDINNTSSVPRKEQNMFHRHLQDMSNEIATVKESFHGLPRLIRGVVVKFSRISKLLFIGIFWEERKS
uniref:Uncharacterized protein n=1 Tax=Panagrolaimus sp. ES5 TaxID=591445 RepID=A0AC34F1R2_9BILA